MDLNDKKIESELDAEMDLQQTQAGDSLADNELINSESIKKSNEKLNENDEFRSNEKLNEKSNEKLNDELNEKLDEESNRSIDKSNENDEFKSDDWIDLLDNKDILKKILFTKETDPQNPTFPRPNRGSRVTINLETKIYSTQQVISSESAENLQVIVGDYDVIHGVDLILPMMHLYEKARVVINPRFGYGEKGRLPDIESNCRLDCTVELLKIEEDLEDLPKEEKILLAEKKKLRGNFWFSRDEYQPAINCYKKCVELFETLNIEELDEKSNRILIDSYNNLTLTQIRTESFNQALESVNQVLFYDPTNVKAMFRKAQILENKCDLEDAVELLKNAIELEPNNLSIANLLIKLRKRRLIELENEKKMYQKMISNNNKSSDDIKLKENDSNVDLNLNLSNANCESTSKKFSYKLFIISAISAIVIAFLINQYLINYS